MFETLIGLFIALSIFAIEGTRNKLWAYTICPFQVRSIVYEYHSKVCCC